MHRAALISALALALASRVAAQGLHTEDIAPNCASVCSAIVTASDACERQYDNDNDDNNNNIDDNDDQQELDCICSAQGMSTAIPECEACQRQYYDQDDDDDDDNNDDNNGDYDDIQTLLSRCGFSSMSATGSMTMTSMGSAPTGGSTTIITSTYTDRDDDDDLETTTITSVLPTGVVPVTTGVVPVTTGAGGVVGGVTSSAGSLTSAAGSAASSATAAVGSATGDDNSDDVAQQTGNLAPAITAAPVLAVAGIAAAMFGL